jgi:hypothetical protein
MRVLTKDVSDLADFNDMDRAVFVVYAESSAVGGLE